MLKKDGDDKTGDLINKMLLTTIDELGSIDTENNMPNISNIANNVCNRMTQDFQDSGIDFSEFLQNAQQSLMQSGINPAMLSGMMGMMGNNK
jgi:Asp-tRNA(Asn)/Glu-tRNA(Gln) amidotransferase C subunit